MRRLGGRGGRGGRDEGAAASPLPEEAEAAASLASAEDEDEVPRERLQKLIGDVVGRHVAVPWDFWEYEDQDAVEEERVAVSVRVTAWDGEGKVFKGVEDVDGSEHEFTAVKMLGFTIQNGITEWPTAPPLRHKRPRDLVGELRDGETSEELALRKKKARRSSQPTTHKIYGAWKEYFTIVSVDAENGLKMCQCKIPGCEFKGVHNVVIVLFERVATY